MEGIKRKKSQSLAVLQEFSGGRLEKQVWSRAYELVAPALRAVVNKVRSTDPKDTGGAEVTMRTISRGA